MVPNRATHHMYGEKLLTKGASYKTLGLDVNSSRLNVLNPITINNGKTSKRLFSPFALFPDFQTNIYKWMLCHNWKSIIRRS